MLTLKNTRLPAALMLVMAAPLALAEYPISPDVPPAATEAVPAVSEVSERELNQFVDAAKSVQEASEEAREKIAAVENADEIERIREEAGREMRWAIEETGLSVHRYEEIFVAFQSDPTFNRKVMEKLNR